MAPLFTYELAELAGVSVRTLQRWMLRHRATLTQLGYRPGDKYLPPRVSQWIASEYCIRLE